jgi:RHS repeat-associated protein
VIDDGARYVYGAGLEAQISGSNTYYYLADGLGSTMKTVDASGNVVNSYTYDVYGKKTSSSGSQANEFDFAGQQTDPTGLQYLRARYMDPETGVFISRDPLASSPGWIQSAFSYGSATPTNAADPTGLCSYWVLDCVDDAVSAVWGALGTAGGAIGGAVTRAAAWGVSATLAALDAFGGWMRAQWNQLRAYANKELTAIGLAAALKNSGSCSVRSDLVWICTSVEGIRQGAALTIGNVILTGEKKVEYLRPGLLSHELQHTVQWAVVGLAGGFPAQTSAAALYLLNAWLDQKFFGGEGCTLVAELITGFVGDGGGHCD